MSNRLEVHLKGSPLSADLERVLASVVVKDALGRLDSMEATFIIGESEFSTLATKLKVHGEKMMVKMYADGTQSHCVYGDVISITWTRSREGQNIVKVTGLDYFHRLKKPRASSKAGDRRFRGKKASEIVKAVALDWKLGTGDIQSTNAAIKELEWHGTDAALVKFLAEQNNYIARVNAPNGSPSLVFSRKSSYSGAKTVKVDFNTDIFEMDVTHSLDDVVTKVSVHGQDYVAASAGVKTDASTLDKHTGSLTGASIAKSKFGEIPVLIDTNEGLNSTVSETKDLATGILTRHADTFVRGTVLTRLLPGGASGGKLTIDGAGWPLDGTFIIDEVVHIQDRDGKRSQFTIISDSILPS